MNSFGYGGVNAHAILECTPTRMATLRYEDQDFKSEIRADGGKCATKGRSEVPNVETAPKVHHAAPLVCGISQHQYGPSDIQTTPMDKFKNGFENDSNSVLGSLTRRLFVITSSTEEKVLHLARKFDSWTSAQSGAEIDLDSLAYTLATRRSMHQWRYTFQASSREELLLRLNGILVPTKISKALRILFVFTGQGAQWYAMGRELNFKYPIFRDSLLQSDEILRNLGASWSLVRELGRNDKDSHVHQSEIAQPSSTALQIGLVDLLASFGVRPATVIGHSSGEIAAAYAAGVISHKTALKISFGRSLLSAICKKKIPIKGAMLAVGLGESQVSPLLLEMRKGVVSVACVNSSTSTTVSGDESAIMDFQIRLNDLGVFNRKLRVDTAYHSHHMSTVAREYLDFLGNTRTNAIDENVTFISSVTGTQKTARFGWNYWVKNLVSKVCFLDALKEHCKLELPKSHSKGTQHFSIEIGPHGTLAGPIQDTMTEAAGSLVHSYSPALTRGRDAVQSVLSLSGRLLEHGYPVNIQAVNCLSKSNRRLRVLQNLPTFPWDHSTTYWHESRLSREYRMRQHPFHDLLGIKITSSPSLEPSWRYVLSLDSLPWLADHVIDGLITFPGAGYVCMAIEASKQLARDKGFNIKSFVLQSVSFMKALVIPPAPKTMELQICFRAQQLGPTLWDEFRVYALSENHIWHEHCRGRILANSASDPSPEGPQSSKSELPEIYLAGSRKLTPIDVYSRLQANGNDYGPCFACIKELQIADSSAVAYVAIPDIQSTMPAGYQQRHVIHPTTLDALLHTAVPLYEHRCGFGSVMPVFIEEMSILSDISRAPGEGLIAAVEIHPNGERSAFADISVSVVGKLAKEQLLMISGIQLLGVGEPEKSRSTSSERRDMAYQLQYIPKIRSKAQTGPETDLTLGNKGECIHGTPLLDSPRAKISSPNGDYEAGNNSEQLGVQINLVVAHRCQKFATVLTALLCDDNHKVKPITWASRAESAQATYIVLDDREQPFLESPTEALFQHIIRTIDSASNIFWVSAQVRKVDTSSIRDPKSALMTGFARSTRAEYEHLRFTTLDIPDYIGEDLTSIARTVAEVVRRSLNGCDEMEYIYRESQVLVPRLVPDRHLNNFVAQAGEPQLEEVLYLRSNHPLRLDTDSTRRANGLYFVDGPTTLGSLKADEVEVEALAQSFDLRHTEQNKGQTPDPKTIISEFAGTVRAIGSKVQTAVRIGDVVIGWKVHGLAYVNHPRTAICNITRIPSHWSLSVAAAMAVPLMAGYYSLVEIAKLRESQSILIYGTAGLYGQLAIAMAKSTGAKVFATVSTIAQQEELATKFDLPPSRFLSDRDIRLKREVLRLTAGKGVDVVLAMPSDGPVPELGGCVAGLGKYVQVLQAGEDTHVIPPIFVKPAITFVSFDVDNIAQKQPENLAHSLEKAVSMLPDEFAPIGNVKCIPVSQIEDAIAESRKLKAPDEIILTADADTKVRVRHRTQEYSHNLQSDATYVIAGGLGDLGQKVSISMAKHGAKHLVLLSRRSISLTKVDSLQESLQQYSPGLRLYAISCDISKSTATQDIPRKLANLTLPAVRGVLQSAAVLHDRVLEQMTAEDWQLPLQTKMHGTRNLDEAFRSSSLDFFVMISSLSGVIGTRGQANYAAGNTYQDGFAQSRVGSRTAYIALDLGMIEHGAAYENKAGQIRAQNLLRQGLIPIKSEQLNTVLEWVLSPDTWRQSPGQFAIGIDGASIREAENATPTTTGALFTHVRGVRDTKEPIRNALPMGHKARIMAAETLEEAEAIISEATSQKIASLISVGKDDVDQDRSLQDLGVDSLTAIEIKNFVRKEFDATVHASEILDEPCLAALSKRVASRSEVVRKKFGDPPKQTKSADGANQTASPKGLATGSHYPLKSKLPVLPLPSVEDTMNLYLTSARPFLEAREFERTSEAVRIFKGQAGKLLQEKLESRRKAPNLDNWQHDLQVLGVYLRRRSPIHPFGTFYGVHLLTGRAHSQVERAAIIAETAYAFQRKLEASDLEPDYLNDERLCPQSLNWLFNACREPRKNVDKIRKHERNKYLVVLRRGHVFKIELEQKSQPVTRAKLRKAFAEILDLSSQILPSIATLTADERDSWAELRGVVKSINRTNHNTIDTIEAAAFVICLDDNSPATPTERCNSLLLGDPGNRWSDKTLQFVVCANGVSGYVCEHSMLDVASLRQLNESITTVITEPTVENDFNGTADSNPTIMEELRFSITNAFVDNIDRVRNHVMVSLKPVEFAHFKLPSMGNIFFRDCKVPSKSATQTVIQLASLLCYGVQYPSWETLTMMFFHSGRLDWIQTVSPAMFKFCETAFREDITFTQRSKLLREAAGTHTSTMTRISRGRGFAAHLEALREVAEQEDALPEFFSDPTWEMMRVLSPRKIKTDASTGLKAQEAGFYMPDPESVFVHYEIDDAECRFFVQSTEGRTERFCEALEKAAEHVRRLLEES